jgi:hypothetical protein
MINYIYTLTDPRDNKIKYIGKTKNDINKRLIRHINESNSNSKKDNWIKLLKKYDLIPTVELLDIGDSKNINSLEIYWISQFIAWGFDLKNTTNGGDGGWDNIKHTEISKEKMRNNNPNMKSVVLFDINMKPLKKFKSLREASRESGLERPFILRSCKKNTTVCGCYFKHSSIDFEVNENWKNFLIKREYNKISDLYNNEEWNYIIQKSLSYKDICVNIQQEHTKLIESKIYRIIKKLKIDTSHFTRKKQRNERL